MTATVTACSPLDEALALADAQPDVRAAAHALRQRYPGARIVVVDAFDMRAEPCAATGQKVALWYGASDGHCWTVTADPAQAVGLFIAAQVSVGAPSGAMQPGHHPIPPEGAPTEAVPGVA